MAPLSIGDKMMTMDLDEPHIEKQFKQLKHFADGVWHTDLTNVEAIVERIRLELIIEQVRNPRKTFYRAVIDYLEDVVDERYKKENKNPEASRRSVREYIKSFLDGTDD